MKKIFNIAANLRVLFGAGRFFIGLIGIPCFFIWVVLLVLPANASRPSFILPLWDTAAISPAGLVDKKSPAAANLPFVVTDVSGRLQFNLRSTERLTALRYTILPHSLALFGLWWIQFGLLRELCRRAEKGEIFSDFNLRAVRNVGVVMLASVVSNYIFSILAKVTLSSAISATAQQGLEGSVQLRWLPSEFPFDLIPGLFVLLLAEAFRQGLALKKENDLTV